MAMNDPVLQRSMFRGPQPTVAPGAPAGIRSMTTPDENAQALRNMFRAPAAMMQPAQPVQSFQDGGEVIDYSGAFPGTEPIPQEPAEGLTGIRGLLQRGALALRRPRPTVFPEEGPIPPPRPEMPGEVRPLEALREVSAAPGMALPAEPPRAEGIASIKTNLSEIREDRLSRERANLEAERRQRTAADRRENALLALLQAGLATAAGTSRNAITNIGAGGQAGVAAFAGMERARREDEASRRREETSLMLAREQLRAQEERAPEQIRTLAMLGGWTPDQGREGLNAAITRGIQVQKSMEKDPEMIRMFQILGNGDVRRGFDIYNADRRLQAAVAVTKDITASEEDKRAANEYIRGQLAQGRAATGSGQAPPPGSTVIPFNQLPVR